MKSLGKNCSQMTFYSNNILSQPKAGVLWLVSSKGLLATRLRENVSADLQPAMHWEIIHYFLIHVFDAGFLVLKEST